MQAVPRSSLVQIEQVEGYNPVQLRSYWMFVRQVTLVPLPYHLSLFHDPPPAVIDLLQVRYVVSGAPYISQPSRLIARPGRLGIYEVRPTAPRASVLSEWVVVRTANEALRAVTEEGFDPSRSVVLEGGTDVAATPRPRLGFAAGEPANATYMSTSPEEAVVRTATRTPSVLLVRTPYHRIWKATIDGWPTPVEPGNFLAQAVRLPAGSHTVRLRYDDPLIGIGLAGTVISVGGLVVAGALARARERRT